MSPPTGRRAVPGLGNAVRIVGAIQECKYTMGHQSLLLRRIIWDGFPEHQDESGDASSSLGIRSNGFV